MSTISNVIAPRRRVFPVRALLRSGAGSGLGLASLGVLTFSFSTPMTKVAVRGLSPLFVGVGRAAVAAMLAAVVLVVRRCPRPTAAQLPRLAVVVLGVVLGFPVLSSFALRHVPSAHGSVVIGLLPLATAGFAVVRAGERPSRRYWACSAVGLVAVAAYALSLGGGTLHAADLLLIGAVLAAGLGYTEGALLAREMGGWQVICWALVLAAPVTLAVAGGSAASSGGLHATAGQWAAFGYVSVFSMLLGFFAWYGGLARAGIARAGQLQLAQPGLAVLWGWPLLGERPTVGALVTAAVVFGAVAVGRTAAVR